MKIDIRETIDIDDEVGQRLANEGRNQGCNGTLHERIREALRVAMVNECVAAKFLTGKYRTPDGWIDRGEDPRS